MEKTMSGNKIELQMMKPDFEVEEAFNKLRTNIVFSGEDIKTIVVTSTHPAEGKSYIAMQIAKSFADIGKKVVYVDCDLRRSITIARYKIRGRKTGITEFLTGQSKQLIYETNVPNLSVVLSGHSVPNPIELLNSGRFDNMMEMLRDYFDYVIIDTPPLGSVVDASVISAKADGTIMVVRADVVMKSHTMQTKKQLEMSKSKILGVVLNGVNTHKGSYYYRYSGSYGDYYEN